MEELNQNNASETIDFNKFEVIIRNNIFWIALILILTNATAFLYVRYTKDLYESVSEIKLDVKQNATELGIREFTQDNNINLISGEIETIQSPLFLNNVIDSLDLNISYFSIGQLLNFELYPHSPFKVEFLTINAAHHNQSFFVEEKDFVNYELRIGEGGKTMIGTFDKPLLFDGSEIVITKKAEFQKDINYSFVYNSRSVLLDYLNKNLTVEPLNFNAKTISVILQRQ